MLRLDATYRAVTYCCLHRLGDRALAEAVGIRVVAGLPARAGIFRFTGLPFSGRIGALAERWIVEARAGRLARRHDWADLLNALRVVPDGEREAFVLTCVLGRDDACVARALACDEAAASARRQATIRYFESIVAATLPNEEALERITDDAELA
ncbi:MAG: hypothetical protein PVSMB8_01290 [Vulcanimicrobiaceae bacterium]